MPTLLNAAFVCQFISFDIIIVQMNIVCVRAR